MADELVTTSSPWGPQQDPLIYGFDQARQLYDQGAPQYYPGSTVAPYGDETLQGLNMYEQQALGAQPVIDAATQQLSSTLDGDYLSPESNPYLREMSDAVGRQMTRQYSEGVAPGVQGQFSRSGRSGSGLFANAMDSSRDTFQRGLGEMNANLYGGAYNNERNRQMQAIGYAPETSQMQYQPAAQMLNVGSMYDQKDQQNVEDDFNRYNFNENTSPYDNLGRYMGYIRGNYGGEGSQSQDNSLGIEDWIGLGTTGYGLAQELFGL